MKVIITGGHLTPALAVIGELKKSSKDLDILFIGRKHPLEGDLSVSPEYKIITRMGIPFVSLTTGRLQRRFTRYTLFSLLKIPIGFLQSLWWVGKFQPDVILSFGGYVAVPVVVAGWLFRVPIITHEQTATSGLANKIISFFAKKICASWPDSAGHFPKDKVVLTGNPVRKEIFEINQNSQLTPLAGGHNSQLPAIYITGGSLGSHVINEAVGEILPQLLEKYVIIHQCGDSQKFRDFDRFKTQNSKLKTEVQKRYFLTKYVESQDIGWVLNEADLVVSRAGANTVTELAALGKVAILIPLPWAGVGEQEKNAQILVDCGAAVVLPQENLSPQILFETIQTVMGNITDYKKHASYAQKLVDLSAAQKIAKITYESAHKKTN